LLAQDTATSGSSSELRSAWLPSGHPSPTWPEARQLAFDCAVPLAPVEVPLALAAGLTLTASRPVCRSGRSNSSQTAPWNGLALANYFLLNVPHKK